jgi:hypothetical protein
MFQCHKSALLRSNQDFGAFNAVPSMPTRGPGRNPGNFAKLPVKISVSNE